MTAEVRRTMQELVFQFRFEVRGIVEGMPFELLPHGFQNLMRGAGAQVGGEQRIFELCEQLGIDFLFARDQIFDLGGDLRPRLRDRLLQPVEQGICPVCASFFFIVAEDEKA